MVSFYRRLNQRDRPPLYAQRYHKYARREGSEWIVIFQGIWPGNCYFVVFYIPSLFLVVALILFL